jgi:ppGpp synthetase/RelA/SpoT-type nucleotidyltranferase
MAGQPTEDTTSVAITLDAKPTLAQYPAWLVRKKLVTNLDVHKNHYDATTRAIDEKYRTSEFWRSILGGLKDVDAQYTIEHKYPLIALFSPELLIKPWRSFVEKTYRKNILSNVNFPNSPDDGWLTPENWYAKIHDIIRTTIIVKYLDGVPLLVEFLKQKSEQHDLEFHGSHDRRPRAAGSSLAHLVVRSLPAWT